MTEAVVEDDKKISSEKKVLDNLPLKNVQIIVQSKKKVAEFLHMLIVKKKYCALYCLYLLKQFD